METEAFARSKIRFLFNTTICHPNPKLEYFEMMVSSVPLNSEKMFKPIKFTGPMFISSQWNISAPS